MIEVLLTTLETEMSTTAVDQDQVLAEQTVDQDLAEQTVDQDLAEKIENIISKVHRILNVPEKTDEIDGEVAYQFIRQLENNKMFRNKLRASDRCKWADFLVMLPYSERSPKYCENNLADFDALLTKPLLEILEIGAT
ncbi:MAG: hypothetical protein Q4A35_01310 [Candidatus Gracilibacteria bacterium]|nr:hypothetical protein [Candidatus Gracilibacteria bacterium]